MLSRILREYKYISLYSSATKKDSLSATKMSLRLSTTRRRRSHSTLKSSCRQTLCSCAKWTNARCTMRISAYFQSTLRQPKNSAHSKHNQVTLKTMCRALLTGRSANSSKSQLHIAAKLSKTKYHYNAPRPCNCDPEFLRSTMRGTLHGSRRFLLLYRIVLVRYTSRESGFISLYALSASFLSKYTP